MASCVRSTSSRDSLVDVPGQERRIGVAVHAADERGDVDIDDVAVSDHRVVRDAVADDLVQRGAQRLGEAAVAEGAGVGAMVDQELMADPVQLVGGDAGRDVPPDLGQCLRGEPAGHPHPLDRLGVLDVALAEARGTPADVLGAGDARGHARAAEIPGRAGG